MAKAKIICFHLLCFLALSGALGQGHIKAEQKQRSFACYGSSEADQRAELERTFSAEVGVREEGGANSGSRVEQYLAATKLTKGYAWCASFVSWCYVQAGIDAPISAWVPSFAITKNMVYKRGEFVKKMPETGDVFLIWFPKLGRPAHIGFVERWGDRTVITVEGNTNDNGAREGDGVYRKRRLQKQVWAVCDFINNAP